MKHNMIKIVAILSILLCAGYALAFQGAGCPQNRGESCEQVCGRTDMIPDLTEDQKTAIATLKEGFISESSPLRDEIRAKHQELRTLMQSDPVDKEAVYAKQEEISSIKDKLQKRCLSFQLSLSDLLTPEQRKSVGSGTCPMGQGGGPGMGHGPGKHGKGMGGQFNCPALQNKS